MKLNEVIGRPEFDRRAMLYFQTRALEYELPGNFDVDAELTGGTTPKLKIRFPEHYDYDIDVMFVIEKTDHGSKTYIKAVIDDRTRLIRRNDSRPVYIMLQTPNSINVFVVDGFLNDGSDDVDCPTWHAAIDFFMREVDGHIKQIWAVPGSHSSPE